MIEIGSRHSVTASPASDPLSVKLVNGGRVNVGGRGNGTNAAVPQIGEQERFAADKNIEARHCPSGRRIAVAISDREGVEKSARVFPIARAVFHPGDRVRVSVKETLDQSWCDPDDRDWRNVVEINFQSCITDALYHF